MIVRKITLNFRVPTVQYGYEDYTYVVEMEEGDNLYLEDRIAHLVHRHDTALNQIQFNRDTWEKMREEDQADEIPFN